MEILTPINLQLFEIIYLIDFSNANIITVIAF